MWLACANSAVPDSYTLGTWLKKNSLKNRSGVIWWEGTANLGQFRELGRRRLPNRHLKKWSRHVFNFIALIQSRSIRQMLSTIFGVEIFLKLCIERSGKEREYRWLVVTSSTKHRITRHFQVLVSAVTAKKSLPIKTCFFNALVPVTVDFA